MKIKLLAQKRTDLIFIAVFHDNSDDEAKPSFEELSSIYKGLIEDKIQCLIELFTFLKRAVVQKTFSQSYRDVYKKVVALRSVWLYREMTRRGIASCETYERTHVSELLASL